MTTSTKHTSMVDQSHLPVKRLFLVAICGFLLLGALTLTLQKRSGAYEGEFGSHPDEAAHFTTGLMLHDYIAQGFPAAPMAYAKRYYDHYPKVAMGHYPPGFYALFALWTLALPPTRSSTLLFMAVIGVCLSITLLLVAHRHLGPIWSFGAAAVLVLLPVVQRYTSAMMSDTALAFFSLLAAAAFIRYLSQPKPFVGLLFGLLVSAGIMIKGSGMFLVILPVLALLLSHRFNLLRTLGSWVIPIPVIIICLPWMVFTYNISSEGMPYDWGLDYTFKSFPWFCKQVLGALSVWLLAPALMSLLGILYKSLVRREAVAPFWAVMAGLPLSALILYSVVPIGVEDRYVIPVLPPLLVLAVKGIHMISGLASGSHISVSNRIAAVIGAVLLVMFFGTKFKIPPRLYSGFGTVADEILSTQQDRPAHILISSDAMGEGALIAEVALSDTVRPTHFVYRGSKVLATSDWMGRDYEPQFRTKADLLEYLDGSPISWVVVDKSVASEKPHHELIASVTDTSPEFFSFIGSFSIAKSSSPSDPRILLYRKNHP